MSENFQFHPRPDAHPMEWNELLPPLQHAVRDLLVRLEGAVSKVDQIRENSNNGKSQDYPASCFLVYGERGTGKTTVLLSAKDAVGKPRRPFFKDPIKKEMDHERKLRNDAKRSADELQRKGLVWLEVLDIESMPLRTNLLTTLLTRVRNALYASDAENKSFEHSSILEDSADSARHQLNKLIKDATFMWEEIIEPNTREISSRQINVADISANYKRLFKDAMEALSKELARRNGSCEVFHPIVLPIDNIDRSTTHLYNIVKLAQLVASPYLWLVLAGDREDIETFLERAYWKELITIGDGAGGDGKVGSRGEDEALMMARRQAAAASHKLLPPSHRIQVDVLKPMDTLKFTTTLSGKRNQHSQEQTVYDLLKQIKIPNLGNGHDINFVELFDARQHVEDPSDHWTRDTLLIGVMDTEAEPSIQIIEFIEEHKDIENPSEKVKGIATLNKKYLTAAAQLGLQLPARAVLDLWQLAYWAVNAHPEKNRKNESESSPLIAEKIARTMLRNIIAESKLSSNLGRVLQDRVIDQDPKGATILNFKYPEFSLKVNCLRALDFSFRVIPNRSNEKLKSNFYVNSMISFLGDEKLDLIFLNDPIGKKGSDNQVTKPVIKNDLIKQHNTVDKDSESLPDLVAGWLEILFDITFWAKKSWVLPQLDSDIHLYRFIRVSHDVVINSNGQYNRKELKKLYWPVPLWLEFFTLDILRMRWDKFRAVIRIKSHNNPVIPARYLPWVLAIGWVACVLDTFWVLVPKGWKIDKHEAHSKIKLASYVLQTEQWDKASIEDLERHVFKAAADLYALIIKNNADQERVFFKEEGVTTMRDWLEQKLPLLLSHLYVPLEADVTEPRCTKITHSFKDTALVKHWQNNWPFILVDIEKEYKTMFSVDDKSMDSESTLQPTPSYLKNLDSIGPFADMHTLWLNPNLDGR